MFNFDLFLTNDFMTLFPHANSLDAVISDIYTYLETASDLLAKIEITNQDLLPSDALILQGMQDILIVSHNHILNFYGSSESFLLTVSDFDTTTPVITYSDRFCTVTQNLTASDSRFDTTTVTMSVVNLNLSVVPPVVACVGQDAVFQATITNTSSDGISDIYIAMTVTNPSGQNVVSDVQIGFVAGYSDIIVPITFVANVGGIYIFDFYVDSHNKTFVLGEDSHQNIALGIRAIQIQTIQINHPKHVPTDLATNQFQTSDTVFLSCTTNLQGGIQQTRGTLLFNNQTYINSDGSNFWTITTPGSDGIYLATIIIQDVSDLQCSDVKIQKIVVTGFTVIPPDTQVINYGESITIAIQNPDPEATYTVTGEGAQSATPPVVVTPSKTQTYQIIGTKNGIVETALFLVYIRQISIQNVFFSTDLPILNLYEQSIFNVDLSVRLEVGPSDCISDIALISMSFAGSDYTANLPILAGSDSGIYFQIQSPAIAGDYDLTIHTILQSQAACSDRITKTLSILPSSDAPIISDLSADINHICSGQTVNISITAIGTNLSYQLTATDNTKPYSTNSTIFTVQPQNTTTYTITAIDTFGQSIQSDITIDVDFVVDAGPSQMVQPGQPVPLGIGVAQPGVTYTWSPSDGSISDIYKFPTIAYPSSSTTYTVFANTANPSDGIAQDSTSIIVCVLQITQVRFRENTIYPNSACDIICDINTTGSSYVNVSIDWNGSDYFFSNIVTNISQIFTLPVPASAGLYPFSISVVDINFSACSDIYHGSINVAPLPILTAGADKTIIFGQTTTVGVGPSLSDYTYAWTPQTGFLLAADTIAFPTIVTPTTTTTYKVTATPTNLNQMSVGLLSDSITINVCQTLIKFIHAPTSILIGESFDVTWRVQAGNQAAIHNAYLSFADIYSDQQKAICNYHSDLGYGGRSAFIAPNTPGDYPFTLTVYDTVFQNCSDSKTVLINVCSPCLLAGLVPGPRSSITNFLSRL